MIFYTFIYLNKFAEAIYFSDRNSSTVCKIRTEKVENIQLVVFPLLFGSKFAHSSRIPNRNQMASAIVEECSNDIDFFFLVYFLTIFLNQSFNIVLFHFAFIFNSEIHTKSCNGMINYV